MLDVEILLQKADIHAVLSRVGVSFERRQSKRGHELYFACPTDKHQDDPLKMRASISESGKFKGMFNCWACGFKGNLVHLLRFHTGWDFKQTIQFLEGEYGSGSLVGTDALIFRLRMNKEVTEVKEKLPTFDLPEDYKLITKCDSYDAKRAMSWLSGERNITPEFMELFQIGMTNNQMIGPSIVLPIIFCGEIHSVFYAQPFKGGLKRYPKNSPQGEILYNFDRCVEDGKYVMVESILDVIKFECITGQKAMACFTNMISEEQIRLLRRFDEHGVMPDLDGSRGWDLVDRMVPMVGKGLWVYFCPLGKDPGDCTPEEVTAAIDQRMRYCDYESEQMCMKFTQVVNNVTSIRKQ